MKSIYSKKLVFVLVVLSLLFLTACGESKAKTDKEILQDIIDLGKFVEYTKNSSSADYTIEISNRMTTPEDKIDTMDFDIHLVTDFADITCSGYIKYELYNDGWGVSYISDWGSCKWDIKALKDIDISEVYAYLDSYEQNDAWWSSSSLGRWSTYEIIGMEDIVTDHGRHDIIYEIEFDGKRTDEVRCVFRAGDGTWEVMTKHEALYGK